MKRVFMIIIIGFTSAMRLSAQQPVIPNPPEVRNSFALKAQYDPTSGHNAFSYGDQATPPTIRVRPGSVIKLRYVNDLPAHSAEQCALAPCMNMSNLHFHGLHVSPKSPQDDVLTMISRPGEALSYQVDVPADAPPGLYWYHTHPHGESAQQDLDGMSGAIIVEGIDRYYPEVREMRERVLVLRDRALNNDPNREQLKRQVELPAQRCGTSTEQNPERIFTLNGAIRPQIPIRPGERQFWRIVNASPDLYADLQLGGEPWEILALDGMPLTYHDRARSVRKMNHILIAPAGRVEAIVTGPPSGSRFTLSTLCFDTGADGDPNPAMVIADVVSSANSNPPIHKTPAMHGPAIYKEISKQQLEKLETSAADFTVVFTEDKAGFYINGKKFSLDADPMLKVKVGSLQHWKVVNATQEVHPFHIHQVHFLAYAENETRSDIPEWLDTVNVPVAGTADLIMDFTDPVIRGMSVFHCHLLSHEDKGMMAKILFE